MEQFRSGKTIKIIFSNCNKNIEILSEKMLCEDLLLDICDIINMKHLSGPYSSDISIEEESEKYGISSILMIYESHIALHTWPYYKAGRLVIDSCKEFKIEKVIEIIKSIFNPGKIEIREIL